MMSVRRSLLAALVGAWLAGPELRGEPELVRAFIFGSRQLDCPTYNEPSVRYEVVYHGSVAELQYSPARGWGYEVTNPGDTSRAGYGVFGPFDDSPNNRSVFGDACPEEVYDSFIGGKSFVAPCTGGAAAPCLPREGIVFRVDLPDGAYRFVAAVGSADNPHASRLVVEDGGSGPPESLGAAHVVLVHNHDQQVAGPGVFARVGFEGRIPPPAAVGGFVDVDSEGMPTAAGPSSPTLDVTQGYLRVHQLKGSTAGANGDGGNLVVLEIWRVASGFRAVEMGATWKYLPGLSEPPAAWRTAAFDDGAWTSGAAPIGYGETRIQTDLGALIPPMRNNYTSVYLRRTFQLSNPGAIGRLIASADYDDGFILWINGVEVLRVNGPAGDAVPFDAVAPAGHESGLVEAYDLPDPAGYLVAGTNLVAVQILNQTLTSSDLFFDLAVYDPDAPDLTPPTAAVISPAPGTTVRGLRQIEVTFSEEVSGVGAADLLVRGVGAASVSGSGTGPYRFSFPEPPPGVVPVAWASGHGIVDLADAPNPFGGGTWSYVLDPDAPLGHVVINEILAVNVSGLLDEDGEDSEWIELHNDGVVAVNLAGWALTDDPDEPGKWVFPSVTIGAGEYLVVFASGKDRKPTAGNLHTSFKLSPTGEYLGLYDPEIPRSVISEISPRYPRQQPDIAYGRDGSGNLVYLATPTPGAANVGSVAFDGFALAPGATPRRGFHDGPVDVTLHTGTPGATIRYTIDGSEPSATRGTVYAAPVRIAPSGGKGAVNLRAVAYRVGLLVSEIATHTYVFPHAVISQTGAPAGFPATWNAQPADYAMDSRVVGDAGHADLVLRGLTAIPTLSIATQVGHLFDPATGIYANPSMEGVAWERPTSAELLYPDGREGFQIDCGIRVQGGSSTSGWKSLKVSLRLLFKEDYGNVKLRFPLFPDSLVTRFDTIVLDAHLNQTWNHPDHGQRVRAEYCRDVFMSDLQNAAGGYAPHDVFAHVYLNGLYWGIYDIHERPDHSFAAESFGGQKEDYDCIRHNINNVVAGSNAAWRSLMTAARKDLSLTANYVALYDYLDVHNFVDYMIVNFWGGNDDWAHQNWYATRPRAPGGQYRVHSWDAEHVLKSLTVNRLSVNNTDSPTEIFQRLRASEEFRLLFADRVEKHWSPGGIFHVDPGAPAWNPASPEANVPAGTFMRRIDEADGWVRRMTGVDPAAGSAIACESARWGDAKRPTQPYTRNAEFAAEVNGLLTGYFPQRSATVLGHFKAAGLYPSVGAPVPSQRGGLIEPGFRLTLTRPSGTTGTIYCTTDGTDPRVFGSGSVSARATAYAGPIELVDHTIVQARILSGTTWSALTSVAFSLSAPQDAVRITEIMYAPEEGPDFEFIELANLGATTAGLSGAVFVEGIFLEFPRPTTLAPGEYLVVVANPAAFRSVHPGVEVGGVFVGSLSDGGERITLVSEDGAAIASLEYDDEGEWPIGADGFGFSLVLADPFGDPSSPDSWRASAYRGGSPGAEDPSPPPGGVVISEVLARASSPLEGAIELLNRSPAPRDIGGWYLSDGRADEASLKRYRIPPGTSIPAGGRWVAYEGAFGAGPTGFRLDPAGGSVTIAAADAVGQLTGPIHEGRYGPEDSGVSFGRISTSTGFDFGPLADRTFGADLPSSVEEFRTGTGLPNAGPRFGPVVINEIMYHPEGAGDEFLELHNPTAAAVPLHSAALGRGWRIGGIRNDQGTDSFEFGPGVSIPAGGYVLVVGIEPDFFRALHAVPASVPIVGPFGGGIANEGERLRLSRPIAGGPIAEGGAEVEHVLVDMVRYDEEAPWPVAADGRGPSLERILADSYGNDPMNWDASTRNGGTPGIANTAGTSGANRAPMAVFSVFPASGKAPLDVLVDAGQSYDVDGEIVRYEWDFGDGRKDVGPTAAHTYTTPGTYPVTLTVVDDEGAEGMANRFVSVAQSVGGLQRPGDATRDGTLDIADAVSLLLTLFVSPRPLPCGGDDLQSGGNLIVLDSDGSGSVNVGDAIHVLNHLFRGGPAPTLGRECVLVSGCPDACF